jgi:hypothetical protein
MIRRSFLRNTIFTTAGLIILPSQLEAQVKEHIVDLPDWARLFANPPDSARPWCFYMWMNGNVTKEGITADLETMQRMGIGGAICFNSAVGIPRGNVDYASFKWFDCLEHTVKEAERLGLEITMHNSPGYSGAGGQWITPELSMQQLVWTETLVSSKSNQPIKLLQPYAKHGYYKDAFVIAYPSLPVEKALLKDKLYRALVNGSEIDKTIITDGNPENKIRVPVKDGQAVLELEFKESFEARAITLLRKPEIPRDLFDGPRDHPPIFSLEYSNDGRLFIKVGTINPPELREMDTPAAVSFDAVKAKFFRLVATTDSWVSNVELHNGPRLGGWPGKTGYTHGNFAGVTPTISSELLIRKTEVLDLTAMLDVNGILHWSPPNKTIDQYTILRIGHTTTGEENAAHPDSGKGLELDKFNKAALDYHFTQFLDKVIITLKPYRSFKGFTCDSWEAGKQNWTESFPKNFKDRMKYDIVQWMPALTGRIVESIDETERFLWDVKKTQADLLTNNFYGYFAQRCHDEGLQLSAEPYGDGNLDSVAIGKNLDIPMSEFWTRNIYGSDMTSKQAASIAHVYAKPIVAAEAYTAMPATSKWTDYPYSLKAEGDYFFSLGVNRLTFHTFVHQPYFTGKPGMTMGPFGMHINRNNTWTEQAYGWTNYIKRAQYLLQQGIFVADLCCFMGDDPQSGVPDVYKLIPKGYAVDVVGSDPLHNRFSINEGKIVLPDGLKYQVCIMAPVDIITSKSLARISELVCEGMILVVSSKPFKSFGMSDDDDEVKKMANLLFGDLDGKDGTVSDYGKGKVIWKSNYADALQYLKINPDFSYTSAKGDAAIHYIHKQIQGNHCYFISNHKRQPESIIASFRVAGLQPEIWNPETGKIVDAAIYNEIDGRTNIRIELEAAGSLFIVFRRKKIQSTIVKIVKDGELVTDLLPFENANENLLKTTVNNFSILLWIKPDSFAHSNRSMIFHAPEGEKMYGHNHAAVALSAGQNIIRVYERSVGANKEVLSCPLSIQGWTHVALIYKSGKPSLWVNGEEICSGTATGKLVHPGINTIASVDQYTSYFEGNFTQPELFTKAFTPDQVKNYVLKGLPSIKYNPIVNVFYERGKLQMLAKDNGIYNLVLGNGKAVSVTINNCSRKQISSKWNVDFPSESRIRSKLVLNELESLHLHENFDVKHFSGTCTYSTKIQFAKSDLKSGNRLFLDLGRVEVIAEVKINGVNVGQVWKEPYIIDITNQARIGLNYVTIAVTTLGANRQIGDEFLPNENNYSDHGFIYNLPNWFTNNQPKPGKRKTFSVWKNFKKGDPLLASGLLGPVYVCVAVSKEIMY